MQLEIHNKKLEKLFNSPDKLIKKVGLEMARKIKQRLNELKASSNFKEYLNIVIGKPHPLVGNLEKFYGISLNKNYRLLVEPLIDDININDLKECKKVNIEGVVDYHDGKCEWLIP